PLTVTLPLGWHSTVTFTVEVSAFGNCGPGPRTTAAPNALDTMPITSAESCVEKLPLVGSTQLEPPPQAANAATATTAILLCIRKPSRPPCSLADGRTSRKRRWCEQCGSPLVNAKGCAYMSADVDRSAAARPASPTRSDAAPYRVARPASGPPAHPPPARRRRGAIRP